MNIIAPCNQLVTIPTGRNPQTWRSPHQKGSLFGSNTTCSYRCLKHHTSSNTTSSGWRGDGSETYSTAAYFPFETHTQTHRQTSSSVNHVRAYHGVHHNYLINHHPENIQWIREIRLGMGMGGVRQRWWWVVGGVVRVPVAWTAYPVSLLINRSSVQL